MSEGNRLVVIGAGGFGREVLHLINDINSASLKWHFIGFLDDDPGALNGLECPGKIIDSVEAFSRWSDTWAVCAVADPRERKRLVLSLSGREVRWTSLIHPTARIGYGDTMGEGTIICAGASITVNGRIGRHVHLNYYSVCGHDVEVGDFSTLCPHVDISGHAVLGEGVFVGSQGIVLPGARVGNWAKIGAGAVVLRHVPPACTVFGAPAQPIGPPDIKDRKPGCV